MNERVRIDSNMRATDSTVRTYDRHMILHMSAHMDSHMENAEKPVVTDYREFVNDFPEVVNDRRRGECIPWYIRWFYHGIRLEKSTRYNGISETIENIEIDGNRE